MADIIEGVIEGWLIACGNRLADWCRALASWFEEWAHRLERCPSCGENVWSGRTCDEVRRAREVSRG